MTHLPPAVKRINPDNPSPVPSYTSVHTCESYVDPWIDNASQRYLFRDHARHRELHKAALLALPYDSSRTDRRRMKGLQCGEVAWIGIDQAQDTYALRFNGCGHRLCPRCSQVRAARLETKIQRKMPSVEPNEWSLITLTLSSDITDLALQLDHLTASFRRLRQQQLWKQSVAYGHATIEVTLNPENHLWHPHIHILARSAYLPQNILADAWRKASKHSYIVDVRRLTSRDEAIKYVSKYVAKPIDTESPALTEDRYIELFNALEDRKMTFLFGRWPEIPDAPPPDEKLKPRFVISLPDAIKRAKAGDRHYQALLELLAGRSSVTRAEHADKRATMDATLPP